MVPLLRAFIYSILIISFCSAGLFDRKNAGIISKTDVQIQMKDEQIQSLSSELQNLRINQRILTDHVVFLKGNIDYHKRITSEAKREKESVRRLLVAQMEDMESKHKEDIAAIQAELSANSVKEKEILVANFEEEKNRMIESLQVTHAKEIKEMKKDFRAQLEFRESETEIVISDLKAKLREEKSKRIEREQVQEQDVNELRRALSSATSSPPTSSSSSNKSSVNTSKSSIPPRRSRNSKK